VFPVLTAKHIAPNASLWRCSSGSSIRCSITPAKIWYLLKQVQEQNDKHQIDKQYVYG